MVVADTQMAIADTQVDVADTRVMVADIHRKVLAEQEARLAILNTMGPVHNLTFF